MGILAADGREIGVVERGAGIVGAGALGGMAECCGGGVLERSRTWPRILELSGVMGVGFVGVVGWAGCEGGVVAVGFGTFGGLAGAELDTSGLVMFFCGCTGAAAGFETGWGVFKGGDAGAVAALGMFF